MTTNRAATALRRIRSWLRRRWRHRGRHSRFLVAGLILAATAAACIAFAALPEWFELRPGLAAWVQAVGALLALTVAVIVPVWQAEAAERRARIADIRAAKSAVEMVRDLLGQVDAQFQTLDRAEKLVRGRYYLARLQHAAGRIDRVNASQLSEFSAVAHLTNIGAALAALAAIIGRFDGCHTREEFAELYEETRDDVSSYAGVISIQACTGFIADVDRQLRAAGAPVSNAASS